MFSVICMHQGVRVTQFQFSVCMYGTCGRIDNKADFDFDFDKHPLCLCLSVECDPQSLILLHGLE